MMLRGGVPVVVRCLVGLALPAHAVAGCGERGPVLPSLPSDGGGADAAINDAALGTIKDCTHPPVQRLCSAGWCRIPAGCFVMGSPPGERCRPTYYKETQHRVLLKRAFEISQTEVTQAQFKALMGFNPSWHSGCGDTCPVDNVSWWEAVIYCNRLSQQKGFKPCYVNTGSGKPCTTSCDVYPECCVMKSCSIYEEASAYRGRRIYSCPGYRLPTEAEWEYAYRAGTQTGYYNGPVTHCLKNSTADAIGWYGDYNKGPSPVGNKLPNAWGLHDMAGNLYEWTHDWFAKDLGSADEIDPVGPALDWRVQFPYQPKHPMRGGSWGVAAGFLRAADRNHQMGSATSDQSYGFRCVRSL